MALTWETVQEPTPKPVSKLGWVIVIFRSVAILGVIIPGVVTTLLARLIETALLSGRPVLTAYVQKWAIWLGLRIIGLRYRSRGKPMDGHGGIVANHVGWIDIFTLGAGQRIAFVSKAEVAGWPGIGLLARLVGTVFITRNPRDAARQQAQLQQEIASGRKLLFFPEGTSTDGMRVLPFKSTLFAAFFSAKSAKQVQPVSVIYHAPRTGEDPRFYGWWGDMKLEPHMLQVLAQWPQGEVEVVFHPPLTIADFKDRKSLALAAEAQVRSGMPDDRQVRE